MTHKTDALATQLTNVLRDVETVKQQVIFLRSAAAQLVATATSAATLMSRGTPGAGDDTAWAQSQTDIADRVGRLTGMGCKP